MQGPPLQIIVLPVPDASGNSGWVRREPRHPYPLQPRSTWPRRQPIPSPAPPSVRRDMLAELAAKQRRASGG